MASRVIFHIDMNAFFASVEQAEKPYLRGKPIVVARGDDQSRSSIISTASYEARAFGVHSAMPLYEARKLCPQLIAVDGNYDMYEMYSHRMFEILRSYTTLIEPASIDEGYLDVTSYLGKTDYIELAKTIQNHIYRDLHLPCSVGIAPNKFLAKMASDMKKPMGITVLRLRDLPQMLWNLPVEDMFGVGKKTAPRLKEAGFTKIGHLASKNNLERLKKVVGENFALSLHDHANGIDDDPVIDHSHDVPQSIEREVTYEMDLTSAPEMLLNLKGLMGSVLNRLDEGNYDAQVVGIVVKHSDFKRYTRQQILPLPTHDQNEIMSTLEDVFNQYYTKGISVRLLGAFVSKVTLREEHYNSDDITIFSDFNKLEKEHAVDQLLNSINSSYGGLKINKGYYSYNNKKEDK